MNQVPNNIENKRFLLSLMLLVSAIFFPSCNETLEPDLSRFGYDFFPLQTGQYRTYKVREISFTLDIAPDTSNYELKETVSDSFLDNSGEMSYLLIRFKRNSEEEPWLQDSIWTAYQNEIRATVYENNIPLVKLVFPFKEDQTWDSNGLNARDMDEFRMQDVFSSYSSTFGQYEHTVTVIQEEKLDSIISLDNRYEIYAQNIGLIEKVLSKLDFCQEDECKGQKIIEEGIILTQTLIEYGTE